MKTYVNLLKILFILLILWGALNFFMPKEDKKVLTNVTELYSKFNSPMKKYVTTHLNYVNCNPKEYYYSYKENCTKSCRNISFDCKEICFICNEGDFCFGYTTIDTIEGEKMGPLFLDAKTDFGVRYVDFYTKGLATLFNCKKMNSTLLSCDYGMSIDKSSVGPPARFHYPKRMSKKEKEEILNKICEQYGGEKVIERNEEHRNVTVSLFDCIQEEEKITTIFMEGGYLLV